MKTFRQMIALLGMALGAGAVWLAFSMDRVFSSAPGFFPQDQNFAVVVAALGLAVFIVAYCFGFRWGEEPGASPNGGPAERHGKSGVGGGPPSVN
jgi:hypothetical protein